MEAFCVGGVQVLTVFLFVFPNKIAIVTFHSSLSMITLPFQLS
jgi:hypothetical protein